MYQFILFISLVFSLSFTSVAQQETTFFTSPSQLGVTGLLYTPSAFMPPWKTVDIGFTHFNKEASLSYEAGESPERTFLANMVFWPAVELSLKLTRPYSNIAKNNFSPGTYYGIGDRSISMRIQVLKERKHLPAVLIGSQDVFSELAFFHTNYVVLSKTKKINQLSLATTLGYGFSVKHTPRAFLQGFFGGLEVHWQSITGLVEYDTERLNIGVGYQIKNFLFFKVALIDRTAFTGTVNLRFQL